MSVFPTEMDGPRIRLGRMMEGKRAGKACSKNARTVLHRQRCRERSAKEGRAVIALDGELPVPPHGNLHRRAGMGGEVDTE